MRRWLLPVGLAALVGACSYVDQYESWVHDWEPTYCYQSIGGIECYRKPYFRDERRLVNYFGPHPSRYDRPEPPEPAPFSPPAMVNYWVKDPEPIPRPAPHGDVSDLPWLDPAVARAQADRVEFTHRSADRTGTDALLKHMGIGPHGAVAARSARPAAETGDGATAGAAAAKAPADEAPPPPAVPVPPVVEVPVN